MTENLLRPRAPESTSPGFLVDEEAPPGFWAGGRPEWYDDVDQALVCRQIVEVTRDVKTFVLEPMAPRTFRYDPGQYLTLTVTIDGCDVARCYTISSPPTRPDRLTITVKRVPGGTVSNWLHDQLRVGATLWAKGPLGRFTTAEHPAAKYLFLSAGIGITPLMSMTRTLHDLATPTDVVFVHSAHTPEDIIFRRELDTIAAAAGGVRVVPICGTDSPPARWAGLRGRLSLPMLHQIAPDLLDREIFTCGPPSYLEAVGEMLAQTGADPDRCHEERFDLSATPASAAQPPAAAAPATASPVGAHRFTVAFNSSNRTIGCDGGTNILDAALRPGVNLPSCCGEGMCGTCKSTLVQGTVDMQHAGGIRPREIAANKILICCSKPLEDLVIDG